MYLDKIFFDDLGRKVYLERSPERIVSLCPSITETLAHLNLKNQLVGRTRFCIHPQPYIRQVERVGGTKEINFDRLYKLNPDLIIAEKEENTPEIVAVLEKSYPVFVFDIKDIEGGLTMISKLGKLTNREEIADEMVKRISRTMRQKKASIGDKRSLVYLIWKDPLMGAGEDTYIDSMLDYVGWENLLKDKTGRYPELTMKDLKKFVPDLLLLSSEPYPFKEKHLEEFRNELPGTEIMLVDGEMFSWYGSRMEWAFPYLNELRQKLKKKPEDFSSGFNMG